MATLTVREVLTALKTELEAISPTIGVVQARLSFSPAADQVITDWKFADSVLGDVIKVFIITPENGKESRGTTGNSGFSLAMQNYKITGLLSSSTAGTGAPDLILEDAIEAVRLALRGMNRLEDGKDCFFTGEMDWTPIVPVKIANHNLLMKSLTMAVQDRRLAS